MKKKAETKEKAAAEKEKAAAEKELDPPRRNWRSLKVLAAVLLLLAGILPALISSHILLNSVSSYQVTYRIRQVQSQLRVLTNELGKSDYLQVKNNDVIEAELIQVSNLYEGRILAVNQSFEVVLDTYHLDQGKINISEDVIQAFLGNTSQNYVAEENYFQITLPVYLEGGGEVIGALVAEVSTQAQSTIDSRLQQNHQSLMVMVTAVMLPVAILFALLLLYPFQKTREEMDKVTQGDLNQIKPVRMFRETEAISLSFNDLVMRLRRLDDSRQEFVSNVSHELKTPITSMKVLADSLLEQENVPVEFYREFMGDIREEIERESQIIEDLLTLVRLDKSKQEPNVKKVDLNLFLENLMKRLRPLAKQKSLELILESFRPVVGEIDETKFSLAISNVIENAIKYNVQNGWVRVTLNADYKYFYIKVADSGIGIPKDEQDHVFERFYRADKARSRTGSAGGTGLGLAISEEIVHMHHGAIKLHSVEGEGTTFIVRVPLIYIP